MNMICEFFQVFFLIERFDLRDKEMKYAKELLLNNYRKFYEVAGNVWVELKLQSQTTYVRCFAVVYIREQNAILEPG